MGKIFSTGLPGIWIKGDYRPKDISPEGLITGDHYRWIWKECHYHPERFALVEDELTLLFVSDALAADPDITVFEAVERVTGKLVVGKPGEVTVFELSSGTEDEASD